MYLACIAKSLFAYSKIVLHLKKEDYNSESESVLLDKFVRANKKFDFGFTFAYVWGLQRL